MSTARDGPWLASPALPDALAVDWARSWPSWFGATRTRLPRAADKADLALLQTPLGPVVAKRSTARGWKRPLVRLGARRARAWRAYDNAAALRAAGFATPEPLAVLGRPEDAVLVTRFVAGDGLWEAWSPASASALLELLATELARLHAAGFRHRDLKASNLLLVASAGGHTLVWTDLDGLRHLGTVEFRQRARDLARLGTSFESRAARAAGVRAGVWELLLERYLAASLGRAPDEEERLALAGWTRRWKERWIRHHLAQQKPVQ